jgi:phosphatidylglycerophosphate synthase
MNQKFSPEEDPDKIASGSDRKRNYSPTSRRPIADAFRRTANGAVRFCVAMGIHPDVISYLSIAASAMAAFCFWKSGRMPWLLILGPAFCYLRLWFNMLDGMVALASGKASWRGEILNDLPDRVSDVLIFAGVAHSGLCHVESGYWAAIFALLTAYVGMFGQAVGVQREFSGLMAKPWRMVTLHLGSWLTLALIRGGEGARRWWSLSTLDWTCLVIMAGCLQTIAVRLQRIFRALREKEQRK